MRVVGNGAAQLGACDACGLALKDLELGLRMSWTWEFLGGGLLY